MSKSPLSPPSKWRRRFRRWLLYPFLFLLTGFLLHSWWLPPAIERLAPWAADRFADIQLEIDEVRTADLGRLELRGLRLRTPPSAETEIRADATRLRVEFSLLPLLRGDLSGLELVHGEKIRLEIGLGVADAEPAEPITLPATLPHIALSQVDFILRLPEQGEISVRGIELEAYPSGSLHLLTGESSVLTSEPLFSSSSLELSASYRGAVVDALALSVDGRSLLTTSTVDLTEVDHGAVSLNLHLALAEDRDELHVDLDGEGATWETNLSKLDLERTTSLLPGAPALHGQLTFESSGQVRWDDLTNLTSDLTVRLEDFRGFDREVVSLLCRASTGDRVASISTLDLRQPANRIIARDAILPLETLDPLELLRAASGTVHAEVQDLTALTGPVELPEGGPDTLPEHRIELDARLSDGTLEITTGFLESAGGRFDFDRGQVRWPADTASPVEIALDSRADFAHLDQLGLLVGRDDWAGQLSGQFAITGSWPDLDGHLKLDGDRVRFGTMEFGSVHVDLVADNEAIVAHALRARSGEIQLEGRGTWTHETSSFHDLQLSLAMERIESWLGGDVLSGSVAAEISVSGPIGGLQVEGSATARNLRVAEIEVSQARLRFDGGERTIRISELHGESVFGKLDAKATVTLLEEGVFPIDVTLDTFSLVRDGQGLALQTPCRVHLEENGGRIDALGLRGEVGELDLDATWSGESVECRVEARGLRPDHFLAGTPASIPRLAAADLTATLAWSPQALAVDTHGELRQLIVPRIGSPIDARWKVIQDEDQLEVSSIDLRGAEGLRFTVSGSLPVTPLDDDPFGEGELALLIDSHLPLGILGEGFAGAVDLGGAIDGSWEALGGHLALAGQGLRVPETLIPYDLGDGRIDGEIHLDSGIVVDGLAVHLGDLIDARVAGRLTTELDATRWATDSARLIEDARVQGKATLTSFDVDRLEPLLSQLGETAQQLRGGRLSGSFEAEGPLLAPELRGELEIHEGMVRLGSGLPTADRLDARLRLEGTQVQIESMTGDLGGAPFTLTGEAELGGDQPMLAFHLEGTDILLFRSREAKVRANANLDLTGPLEALVARGTVEITDGRFQPTTEFLDFRRGSGARGARGFQLFRFRDAPLRDLSFDLELTARESFRISNTVIKGSVRPDLHLSGTGQVPILTGTVYLEPTLMKLPASSLELTGGTVLFRPESPFLPEVEAQGQTRMLGYSIKAAISGPYDSPEIMLTSTPPMNQENLLLLVLTGRLPNDPDQTDPLATANTVALYVATDTLARWFTDEGPMNEDSLANRFEFVSGREVSRSGVESVEIAYRISNKEGLPEEERNRRHVYLAAERDEFEYYNYGLRLVFRLR